MANRHMLRDLAEGVDLASGLSVESFEAVEFDRVRATLWMALVVEAIPRRLGKGADGAALALDKRVARQVGNLYRSLWAAYENLGADPAPAWRGREERLRLARTAPLEARRAGAVVRWGAWFEERRADLSVRRGEAAALALKVGMSRWGVTRVRLIESELSNVERIAGEIVVRVRRRAKSGA